MLSRFTSATVLSLFLGSMVFGQTIRFDTNVGNFDLVLNPTENPNLQRHVDNTLAYVNSGRYNLSAINRAPTDFVLQMGGFTADSFFLPENFNDFNSIQSFNPVVVDNNNDNIVDFDVTGLNNTPASVSLALSSFPGTNPPVTNVNSGNSSFFVNIGTNSFLDGDFVPFAIINDMATVNLIMSLDQKNYDQGGLAGDNVPVLANDQMVIVKRAFEIDESIINQTISPASASSSSLAGSSASATSAAASSAPVYAIPEPTTIMLAAAALFATMSMTHRKLS